MLHCAKCKKKMFTIVEKIDKKGRRQRIFTLNECTDGFWVVRKRNGVDIYLCPECGKEYQPSRPPISSLFRYKAAKHQKGGSK